MDDADYKKLQVELKAVRAELARRTAERDRLAVAVAFLASDGTSAGLQRSLDLMMAYLDGSVTIASVVTTDRVVAHLAEHDRRSASEGER